MTLVLSVLTVIPILEQKSLRNLEAFERIVDQFEIVHDDVAMRLFSQYLSGDVGVWFRFLEVSSIGS
jgi:hypothetical protein